MRENHKKNNLKDSCRKWGILFAVILAFTACQNESKNNGTEEPQTPVSVTGVSLEDMDLTVFASQRITPVFEPANATNRNVTWSSSDPDVVSVSANGTVTALKYTDETTGTGQATITVTTEDGGFTASCAVTTTMTAQVVINDLTPLKRSFRDYFMMGNIFDPGDVPDNETINKPWLTYHYNILTPQNQMKPQLLCAATRGQYNETNIDTAKRMIAAAKANGIQVQGHCLLWHDQIPTWQQNLRQNTNSDTPEQVLGYMKEFITYIVNEFKGSLYAWDVLNEVFPDGVGATGDWKDAMRSGTSGNPWYVKLGADFVYEGFLAVRLADPDVILYYNDYNLDQVGKSTMVRNMVRDVNVKYAQEYPGANGRKLIEGIGMQSHHNSGVTATAIKNTLELFKPLGVRISISELDLLAQSYNEYSGNTAVTNAGLLKQATQYSEYFKVFLDYSDIIERVTFWGVNDGSSWRSRGLPLPFAGARGATVENIKAKPAYYKIIEALENY